MSLSDSNQLLAVIIFHEINFSKSENASMYLSLISFAFFLTSISLTEAALVTIEVQRVRLCFEKKSIKAPF